MKKDIFLISLVGLFAFAGCTGFNQDPFKEKMDAIKNAQPPNTKPDTIRPLSPGAASIVVSNKSDFVEGQKGTLTLSIRSLLEGYDYAMSIKNLDKFPGAIFDAKTGEFFWTPSQGTVLNGTGVQKFVLEAMIVATPNSPRVANVELTGSESIDIHVQDIKQKPKIKMIKDAVGSPPNNIFIEGSSRSLVVTVEDLDAANLAGKMPTLLFSGKTGVKSLAPYTTASAPRFLPGTNEWEFDVKIDLTTADVTKNADAASLIMSVQSHSGLNSLPSASKDYTVLMKFGSATSNLPIFGIDFKVGVLNTFPFIISDINNEAITNVVAQSTLPVGAVVTCEASARPFQQCVLKWTPTASNVGTYQLLFTAELKNPSVTDTRSMKNNVQVEVRVSL